MAPDFRKIRMGKVLSKHKRNEYVLSTKVGRLILDEIEPGTREFGEKGHLFEFGRPQKIIYDYSPVATQNDDGQGAGESSAGRIHIDGLPIAEQKKQHPQADERCEFDSQDQHELASHRATPVCRACVGFTFHHSAPTARARRSNDSDSSSTALS